MSVTTSETEFAPSPKADPETLVLRGSPGRVTRFRRGAVIAIAAAGSTAIFGITWLALKPAALSLAEHGPDREVAAKAPTDALAGAPSSYGDVPQLGPPLPGDLGRPILNHQREGGSSTTSADPEAEAARRRAAAAEAERQRLADAERAARESGVMLQLAGGSPRAAQGASDQQQSANMPTTVANPTSAVLDVVGNPSPQQRKSELVGRSNGVEEVNPHSLTPAISPWALHAGSIISASLITGLNSDLPGLVTAQVTEHVYDSVSGSAVLIPQGSRLIGSYDNVVAFGQSRALVVWQRIILPDGSSIRIDNVRASDTQGYAGLSDRVDRHTWQLLKGVALSTILGVGTELSLGSNEGDLVSALREAAQQSGARAGDQLVQQQLSVQPTLRVRPGWPLRIVVHKDLVLPHPWGGRRG